MNNDVYPRRRVSVSDNASIVSRTKISIKVQIRDNAQIGLNYIISKDVYIDHAVKTGNDRKVQNSVSTYHGVEIGGDVFAGPNVCFTNDKVSRGFNTEWQVTETHVGTGAGIGANANIVCGVRIGEYAMVAAGSVVTKNVPPAASNPARPGG